MGTNISLYTLYVWQLIATLLFYDGDFVFDHACFVWLAAPRPLKRGFSKIMENESLVDQARRELLDDISEDSHTHMFVQAFILPDLTVFSSDYRAFLEKDLIETSTLVSLEQAGKDEGVTTNIVRSCTNCWTGRI